jgi:hypothetical protein
MPGKVAQEWDYGNVRTQALNQTTHTNFVRIPDDF